MFPEFRRQVKKLCGMRAQYLEVPRRDEADLALPCFALAKEMRKPPEKIAAELAKEFSAKMHNHSLVKAISSSGPYVNFHADWQKMGDAVIREIIKKRGDFGRGERKKEKIMIEYSSPNTNKPLHIGHLRNDSMGMAVGNVLEFNGYDVIRTAIINDRGVHICKSMCAYTKWGRNRKPDKKPDHFVGDFYVMFERKLKENPELENEIRDMLRKWEAKDRKVRALWKRMNSWVLAGMKETYNLFGSRFDFWTLESGIYNKAKPIIEEGMKKGVFFAGNQGDILARLEPELPNKVVVRADGTSIYMTQDLVLAKMRFERYRINRLVYVVASEQNLHFRQLFAILHKLGYGFADSCYHLSYGLVNLPSGRMKTREGTVVDADDMIADVIGLARAEIKKREDVPKKELEMRSKEIALAAIKYYLLRMEPIKDLLFDPGKAVSFEGDTGPYLQYTYARARSILRKSRTKPAGRIGLEEDEIAIAKKLSQFPFIVKKCAQELKPHYLANYLFELATAFNEFYHAKQVIGAKREQELLLLVGAVATVLKTGLELLGMKALEKM